MAIQLRSFFPLALPGMLALLGWWWFYSRKKEHIHSHNKHEGASSVSLRTDPTDKEPLPVEDTGPGAVVVPPRDPQLPEKKLCPTSKPSVEPPAFLRPHPAARRSESSGSLLSTTDTRLGPGTHKDDCAKVELALTREEAKSIALECPLPSPKELPLPQETVEVCKEEHVLSRTPGRAGPGHSAALPEKHGPGEMGWAEGTGDAVPGENVLQEVVVAQEHGSELEKSKAPSLAPLEGGEEKGKTSLLSGAGPVQREDYVVGGLSSLTEPLHTQLMEDEVVPAPGDSDLAGEVHKEKTVDEDEMLEQAALQIISKVISGAAEEVRATTLGKITGQMCQASESESPCPGEEGHAPVEPRQATAEAAVGSLDAALALSEDPSPPKTYTSCLNSPLSSPTKDSKLPRNSVHHISLVPCPSQATAQGELPDEASALMEDAGYITGTLDSSQDVPSVGSSVQGSDSASMSGLEDSCTDATSSPRDKDITPPLPESTVPFSNGVLKEELSDLGAEDGWSMDAETDHSGGSDGNSMDSVDSCCSLRKTEGFQSAQAGSDPKKVDLIIWEIEVPKHLVGRLIGKQGRYVSFLKQTSGAKIYISTLPYTQNIQICHIEGSQHHVDKALNLIGKKFKELNLTNIYAPPLPSLTLPSLPMTSWLMLPNGITVEVIVVNQVNAGHLFVQQHTHPTFHALRSLDQQMYLCYSQPGIPTLPIPVEIAVICAAPGADGAWWRAQVVASYEETNEVEIRYVDYGGYKRVKVDELRQIRSDFVTLPFQGAEVLLESVMPLSDEEHFSPEADAAMSEMTGNTALLAQVTSYSPTGLPLIQLWSVVGDEVVLINRWLVERGLAQWVDTCYPSL
ncbi:PREDICTED: A-kinase anchor protein 1, mitochondrial [Chrysochloris asiatica]|uniref:A-kinase anchor protein 1, mitochondrial n=1 Tax=Chrysochloris asiatica TaxID=185453 RepID=A0A9B0SY03_CHRAS|nr:PREDICTED: A-kinase anchor protein 1, mitochondrial [Chrysochloris asiatica]